MNKQKDQLMTECDNIGKATVGFCDVFEKRKSVRAFLPDLISDGQLQEIFRLASTAPSGGNMQPWKVNVLGPTTIDTLYKNITEAINTKNTVTNNDYQFYPLEKIEPYSSRITQSSEGLYDVIGLSNRDVAQKRAEKLKNYNFFGAPVGLILTIDRKLEKGSWVDMGIFIGYLIQAINSLKLGCCVQASFSDYGDIVRSVLNLSEDDVILCGVAIGKADTDAAINKQERHRASQDSFVKFHP